MVAHTFNTTLRRKRQPGLYSETISKPKKKIKIHFKIHAILLKFKYYKVEREEPSHSYIIHNSL